MSDTLTESEVQEKKRGSFVREEEFLGKEDFTFEKDWCQRYFSISGDKNALLHGEGGRGVIQGSALITRVSSLISNELPDYQLRTIVQITFLQELHFGDTVTMSLHLCDKRSEGQILQCKVRITRNDEEITQPSKVILYKK